MNKLTDLDHQIVYITNPWMQVADSNSINPPLH